MARVVVVSTGGTIASRTGADGVTRAEDPVDVLLRTARAPEGVELVGVEADRRSSFALGPVDIARLVARAEAALGDPDVLGVVVTHGSDTLEASALLAHLVHDDPRPLVLTGAMRAADVEDADGPRNLTDAVAVAASPQARGLGALVVFDGEVLPATGTQKVHTARTAAFAHPEAGPLGHVTGGAFVPLRGLADAEAERLRATGLTGRELDLDGVRVDVVPSYPGADGALLRAAVDAGARAVVLEGTGAGNANPALVAAVADVADRGVLVAVTTRVHAGPVAPAYGGGGGADLVAAGAVPLTRLRTLQAVVLLAALLATTDDPDRLRAVLALW
ncbi:asparaginase [Quadrisphaera sp. DSM 44207]|uniref:asparaginase n=1 Tax=Quadrisphaera sp. DSM 44207 TaxID=1881057 RepID=UPI00088B167E|nr:asparaginase [Quadrisphaera sp. DSM 44207]SDQ12665.1 L-asparaginase [Quadrisphaera sp. DSM 44207]